MTTNGKHIRQKTKSVNALKNSRGDVECCLTAFRFRITNIVKKFARVPKNDKMIEPTNKETPLVKSNFLSSQMVSHSFSPSSLPLHKAK